MITLFGMGVSQAQTGKRVALLIGNSDYANQSQLLNPGNDVRLIAESAKKAGFQTVTVKNDLGVREFQNALREFSRRAEGAEVALVYYAGHGMEANAKNWLVPVDAALNSDRDLPYEAIDLDHVMASIEGATLRMVVLDACRNNPFGRSWRAGSRAVGRGLAGLEVDDVLVIYAAAPGQVAADGAGGNSPFAKSLATRMVQPGLPVQMLGGVVRDDVLTATNGSQRPFISASITGTAFYLVDMSVNPVSATTPPETSSKKMLVGSDSMNRQVEMNDFEILFGSIPFTEGSDLDFPDLKTYSIHPIDSKFNIKSSYDFSTKKLFRDEYLQNWQTGTFSCTKDLDFTMYGREFEKIWTVQVLGEPKNKPTKNMSGFFVEINCGLVEGKKILRWFANFEIDSTRFDGSKKQILARAHTPRNTCQLSGLRPLKSDAPEPIKKKYYRDETEQCRELMRSIGLDVAQTYALRFVGDPHGLNEFELVIEGMPNYLRASKFKTCHRSVNEWGTGEVCVGL
jgi:hypothetical protein